MLSSSVEDDKIGIDFLFSMLSSSVEDYKIDIDCFFLACSPRVWKTIRLILTVSF